MLVKPTEINTDCATPSLLQLSIFFAASHPHCLNSYDVLISLIKTLMSMCLTCCCDINHYLNPAWLFLLNAANDDITLGYLGGIPAIYIKYLPIYKLPTFVTQKNSIILCINTLIVWTIKSIIIQLFLFTHCKQNNSTERQRHTTYHITIIQHIRVMVYEVSKKTNKERFSIHWLAKSAIIYIILLSYSFKLTASVQHN